MTATCGCSRIRKTMKDYLFAYRIWTLIVCYEFFAYTILPVPVWGQCIDPRKPVVIINETDPAGTPIISLPANGGVSWRYQMKDPKYNVIKNEFLAFTKNGNFYNLELAKTLDLEELRDDYQLISEIGGYWLIFYCSEPSKSDMETETLLANTAVSEFPPVFNTSNINVYVKETKSNFVVITLQDWASDRDVNTLASEIQSFNFIQPTDPMLTMKTSSGEVSTVSGLDYESLPANKKFIEVGVLVQDQSRKTGTASLTVHVIDDDDLPPRFFYSGCRRPCNSVVLYTCNINTNTTGKLEGIAPAPIQAKDGDALGYGIRYSIKQGPSGYESYIIMNPITAEVTVLKPLAGLGKSDVVLTFEAQEISQNQRSTSTTLLISVKESGTIPALRSTSAGGDDNVIIVGAVLGVTIFLILIILVIAMIYYRKRSRKAVHPHTMKDGHPESAPEEKVSKEGKTLDNHRKPIKLTEDEMKVEPELNTWLPGNHLSDMVDLSDEDTLKRKPKNGKPPVSTKMASRDSAFEESSDKKSCSDISPREMDPDYDPTTEYAEVGMITDSTGIKDNQNESQGHVYVSDPTNNDQNQKDINTTVSDSGMEEVEYLTPSSTRVKGHSHGQDSNIAYNKAYRASDTDPDVNSYSELISIDDEKKQEEQVLELPENVLIANINVARLENQVKDSASGRHSTKEDELKTKSEIQKSSNRIEEDDKDRTEYSTPKSERLARESTLLTRTEENKTDSVKLSGLDDGEEDKPRVPPPRPKIRQISGLRVDGKPKQTINEENHYASVNKLHQKKSKEESSPQTEVMESPAKDTCSSNPSYLESTRKDAATIDPPIRRKRLRKRSKHVKAPDEDIYDGTKDYEDLEMDPEFYLDKNKTRIKRSSRIPATIIDPEDTQYWVTVPNDY